jgi:hypothetical protein
VKASAHTFVHWQSVFLRAIVTASLELHD